MKLETHLKSGDLFDQLNKEEVQKLSRFKVKPNLKLKQLCKKFEYWLTRLSDFDVQGYMGLARAVVNEKYNTFEISDFSLLLENYQYVQGFKHSGIFLSFLMNHSPDGEFTLFTKHLGSLMGYLGSFNEKKIKIKGDARDGVGYEMKAGSIEVDGNVMSDVGERMSEGRIEVYGSAGESAGYGMKGGTLIIHGNAESDLGRKMQGGHICIKGNVLSSGKYNYLAVEMKGGSICIEGIVKGVIGAVAEIERGFNLLEDGEITIQGNKKPKLYPYNLGKIDIYYQGKLIVCEGVIVQ